MSSTPFSNKCDILGALWLNYREEAETNEAWKAFFDYNDVALPLSYFIADGIVNPSDDGEAMRLVDETWELFCQYIDIDQEAMYEDISAAFAASSATLLSTSSTIFGD